MQTDVLDAVENRTTSALDERDGGFEYRGVCREVSVRDVMAFSMSESTVRGGG